MREPLTPGALRVARKEAVEVVVVLGVHVDAALVEAWPVEQRDHHDRAADLGGIDRAPEADGGLDAGVLGRVDARGDEDARSVLGAADRDERPAVLLETGVAGEGERAGR